MDTSKVNVGTSPNRSNAKVDGDTPGTGGTGDSKESSNSTTDRTPSKFIRNLSGNYRNPSSIASSNSAGSSVTGKNKL